MSADKINEQEQKDAAQKLKQDRQSSIAQKTGGESLLEKDRKESENPDKFAAEEMRRQQPGAPAKSTDPKDLSRALQEQKNKSKQSDKQKKEGKKNTEQKKKSQNRPPRNDIKRNVGSSVPGLKNLFSGKMPGLSFGMGGKTKGTASSKLVSLMLKILIKILIIKIIALGPWFLLAFLVVMLIAAVFG